MATRKAAGPASTSKSHKSFQPVLPCGNKLLQQKWDQTYYNQHKKLVKAAKPMVDSSAPIARPHLTSKLKKQQVEKERSDEIDRDNINLLKKMQHIMKNEGNVDHRNMYSHHSLSQERRQREMERVAHENKQMLKRIEKVEPIYKVSEWIDDWQRKEELTSMITNYPEIPVARKISDIDTAKDKEVSTTEHHVQVEDSSPVVDSQGQGAQTTETSQQETSTFQ